MDRDPAADRRTLAWWRALCVLAALNVGLWVAAWWLVPSRDPYVTLQLALSGVYVLVCAYRSVLPRVDLERLVFVDTRLSSILLGRSAATVAEICFGLQLSLLVHRLGAEAGMPSVQLAAWAIAACTAAAQAFCWHSVLTLNHVTQAVESLLWAAGLSWMAALLVIVALDTSGTVHTLAAAGIVASAGFVAYVLAFDVPMYLRRTREARARGLPCLSLGRGLRDAWERREPTRRWASWRDDAAWLTPYFSLGVWCSLAMVLAPL